MTTALSQALLSGFSNFITDQLGLYFPKQKWGDLERGMQRASQIFQFTDMESCIQWLMSTPLTQKQAEILASSLTVGETYFFRDTNTFHVLEKDILPALIYKRYQENTKYLRIWSAGCASGEEPYSIAIVLCRLIPDIQNWNITLLSTDINTDFLKKLSTGIYSEWSFRNVSDDIKTAYFKNIAKGQYEILPKIKSLIQPFYLNLAQDNYPSLNNNTNAMDIIFCRNVLMYFSPNLFQKVINKFYDCLVNDGRLFVSPGEISQPYFSNYTMEVINNVTICNKTFFKIDMTPDAPVLITPLSPPSLNMPIENAKKPIKDYKALTQQYANEGKLQEALASNDRAISINKTDANLYYLRALILLELGNPEEAIATLNRVLYLDPGFILAYIVLGNIFKKQSKIREAELHFEYALQLLKKMDAKAMLGDVTAQRLIDIIISMKAMG